MNLNIYNNNLSLLFWISKIFKNKNILLYQGSTTEVKSVVCVSVHGINQFFLLRMFDMIH